SPTYAQPSTSLRIMGRITPSACTPELSTGGGITYSNISYGQLNNNKTTTLADKTALLTINCFSTTSVGIRITDDRAAYKTDFNNEMPRPSKGPGGLNPADNNNETMGLGADKSGNKVGVWWINVDSQQLKVDNSRSRSMQLISSSDGNTWQRQNTRTPLDVHSNNGNITYAIAENGASGTPKAGKVHSFPLVIGAAIAKKNSLDLSSDIQLNGKATFVVYYY
ncbi:MAG: DUF1120 domain-containing protein, partial [Enterobacteriaceae bacterium]